jgi:hydrogenase maturation protease
MLRWRGKDRVKPLEGAERPVGGWPLPGAQQRVLLAGIGARWSGDAAWGLVLRDRLAELAWPSEVRLAELGTGVLSLAQALADATTPYQRLVLFAAVARGGALGSLRRYCWRPVDPPGGAGGPTTAFDGRALDGMLAAARRLELLPAEVVLFEVEPVTLQGARLSARVEALVPGVLEGARREALGAGRARAA